MARTNGQHKYRQTPIRFTPEDDARIADLAAWHPSELGAERSLAEIVRLALKRWHDEGKPARTRGKKT